MFLRHKDAETLNLFFFLTTMKKRLFILLATMLPLALFAREVSTSEVINKATSFMGTRLSADDMSSMTLNAVQYEGRNAYYVVQFKEGWILISADDTSDPVIGYSTTGEFCLDGDMPDNMRSWLSVRAQDINHIATTSTRRSAGWDRQEVVTRGSADAIAPLITVNWNQGRPYNKYCPTINGTATYVGCVAVGMAQAMSVHQYPQRPQGNYSYVHKDVGTLFVDYDKEAPYDWDKIMTGSDGKDELARLLYHVGVSLKMDYGVDGSGTQTAYIPSALQRNFGYSTNSVFYSRASYSGNWKDLLLKELREGRAVCYSGFDPKKSYGHCFNLDGYDGSAFFHVNWGWGGYGNAYFSVDALSDASMGMNYTSGQGIVVGIQPPTGHDAPVSEDITDIMLETTSVSASKPVGSTICDIVVVSNARRPDYVFKVASGNPLIKTVNFEEKNGKLAVKTALTAGKSYPIKITVTNTVNNASLTRNFTITADIEDGITTLNAAPKAGGLYRIDGTKVASAKAKGLYIINNKKVLVK